MGKEKTTSTTVVNEKSERQPTAEETRLNQLDIQLREATQPGLIKTQTAGLDLAEQLLRGSEPLPGFFQELSGGISPQIQSEIAQEAVKDILPSFQAGGLLESGVAADIAARTAGDIRRATQEFNIGNRLNLLNLALSGQAQIQSPILSQAANLGNRLTTLGATTTTGTNMGTFKGQNPFLKSFQTSFGSSFGSGLADTSNAAIKQFLACWVAAEVFDGWNDMRTSFCRLYILMKGPKWFRSLYCRFGKKFASFIKDKPIIKKMIKPVFEWMARKGGYNG